MKSNTNALHHPLLLRTVSGMRSRSQDYRLLLLLLLTIFSMASFNMFAQLPNGFIAKKLTTNNIRECVAMAHAPDGRIFIAERGGIVKQLLNGTLSTIHTVSTTTDSEQGLLGIALHTNFATNGKMYLYYTNPSKTLHYLDVIVLNASSQVTSNNRLMEFDPIINGYHNGGAMVFKGNYLYICIGESNQQATAQDLSTYMGKVLRLQDDGQPAPGNPYYNTAGANRQQKSIWAIGMRNPWFMSMDPQTQKLYVINVGGGYEEINDVTSPDPAKNYDYGWGSSNRSGPDQFNTTIYPVFAYNRNLAGWNSQTCAITGGVAFNPTNTNYPAQYRNKFFFTDWCTGWMRSLDMNNPTGGWQELFPSGFDRILGLSTGIDGNIYYSEYAGQGNIWRLEYTLAQTPVIVNHPLSQTIYAGDNVSFSVTASGTAPFTYQWRKNGVNIAGATSSSFSLTPAQQSDAGSYSVVVTNSFGSATSNGATLTVNPFNAVPVVDITTPATSLTWAVGETVSYSATATDAEDGTMPASAFQWEIQLFHKDCGTCEHSHPGPSITSGVKNGTFTADNGGETSSNIWLRIFLRVTDSQGRTGIDSVDIQPKKVNITVQSSKPGLEVVIGSASVTPYTKSMVVNTAATMVAVTPQLVGDSVFTFSSWNHGGASSQEFRVPATNTTYKANFTSALNTNINVALNKQARALSKQGNNTANSALDGNTGDTRWESAWSDPQWWYVDLGATYSITRVRILWENAKGKDYQIFISNDSTNWGAPVKTVSNNDANINNLTDATGTGRYVRYYGTARTSGYGHSFYEFEVYGVPYNGNNNQNPVATLTAPANNSTYTAPASITLTATASDADGTVSKVEFWNAAGKLGEDATSPYSFTWTNVAAGTYSVYAKAIDNQNGSGNSASATVVVNAANNQNPVATLTAPANNSTYTAPASITLTATASDADGTVSKVEFWNAAGKLGEDATSPYSFTWTNVAAGTYAVYAKAIDNQNGSGNSSSATVVVNGGDNTNLALGKNAFALSRENAANAAQYAVDGNATTTRWSSQFSDPQWWFVDLGATYNVSRVRIVWENARGMDFQIFISNDSTNWGTPVKTVTGNTAMENNLTDATGTGRYVRYYGTARTGPYGHSFFEFEVYGTLAGGNVSPTIALTAPVNNSSYTAPASITINATAADSDGSVSLVEFYSNGNKIGEDATSPYSYIWTNVAAGTYALTAKATDNQAAATTSSAVSVTVTVPNNGTNLALGKTARASSRENIANSAQYAVDGNATTTRWSSQFADPQWWFVDLGATYNVNRVRIVWENARGKDYQIFISNDTLNWGTPVKTVTGNTAMENNLTDAVGTGRYVRYYGTARTGPYGHSFYEFEVYGTSPLKMALANTSAESASDELAIYPNPFTDEITIKARFQEAGFVNVILTDQNGYVVYDNDFNNTQPVFETKIGFNDLGSGVYTLKLFSGNEVFSGRLIKQ